MRRLPFQQMPTPLSRLPEKTLVHNQELLTKEHETDEINSLMDEVTTEMAFKKFSDSRKYHPLMNVSLSHRESTSTEDLLTQLLSRVKVLEQENLMMKSQLNDKTKRISVLEEKLDIYKRAREAEVSSSTKQLCERCSTLQKQVEEMEEFLADYGLLWIGKDSLDSNRSSQETSTGEFHVDYDLVAKNVAELNLLTGVTDMKMVQQAPNLVTMKRPEPVPLVLYANGIILFQGPFRPFSDPSTRECIQDIMDGYFPSELQSRYPDGVPFTVTDYREITFHEKTILNRSLPNVFQGNGEILGRRNDANKQTRLQINMINDTPVTKLPDNLKFTSDNPFPRLNVDDFLRHLPQQVVTKRGNLVQVREGVRDQLNHFPSGEEFFKEAREIIQLDATDLVKELGESSVSIRIRSENGKSMYEVHLSPSGTLAHIAACIDQHRPALSGCYDIFTSYPAKKLTQWNSTLQTLGFCPSAVLHLRQKCQPSSPFSHSK